MVALSASYGSAQPNPQKEPLRPQEEMTNYLISTSDAIPRSHERPLREQDCSTPKTPKLAKPKPYNSVCYDGIQHWSEAVADKK
ncbi:hypothetical protein QYM36_009476 [Artemia franciscana]|uniref:Uncharacterized protein n=1 Tax=Artemia franciscana TaxID=6661 RepID=A0AA88HQ97_ARTSF|nr:hypothetical protein QYM36_009476 [Artemia franciscana]